MTNQKSSKRWVKYAKILSIVWVILVGITSTLIFLVLGAVWLFSELTFSFSGALTLVGIVIFTYGMHSIMTWDEEEFSDRSSDPVRRRPDDLSFGNYPDQEPPPRRPNGG